MTRTTSPPAIEPTLVGVPLRLPLFSLGTRSPRDERSLRPARKPNPGFIFEVGDLNKLLATKTVLLREREGLGTNRSQRFWGVPRKGFSLSGSYAGSTLGRRDSGGRERDPGIGPCLSILPERKNGELRWTAKCLEAGWQLCLAWRLACAFWSQVQRRPSICRAWRPRTTKG